MSLLHHPLLQTVFSEILDRQEQAIGYQIATLFDSIFADYSEGQGSVITKSVF